MYLGEDAEQADPDRYHSRTALTRKRSNAGAGSSRLANRQHAAAASAAALLPAAQPEPIQNAHINKIVSVAARPDNRARPWS